MYIYIYVNISKIFQDLTEHDIIRYTMTKNTEKL